MTQLLIVDDESDVREFTANFFRRRGLSVKTATSGEETLQILADDIPQLILLDIKMTGIDGVETLKHIRQKFQDIKVIMVTGQKPEEQDALIQCRNLGILDYVHKPLELDKLEQIVMASLKS